MSPMELLLHRHQHPQLPLLQSRPQPPSQPLLQPPAALRCKSPDIEETNAQLDEIQHNLERLLTWWSSSHIFFLITATQFLYKFIHPAKNVSKNLI